MELAGEQFVIMSDTCSVLKSLRCVRNQHSICRKLKHKMAQMKDNNKNVFVFHTEPYWNKEERGS